LLGQPLRLPILNGNRKICPIDRNFILQQRRQIWHPWNERRRFSLAWLQM